MSGLHTLPLDRVRPNPDQPRKRFDEPALRDLASSIEAHGLMQPIKVRPDGEGYIIIAGERRYRAHRLLEAETIGAIVEETDEQDADEQAIIENLQRVDITALEEANAYQRMIDRYGYTPEELAKRLGLAQPWRVSDRLALLTIREDYRDLYAKGHISTAQARQMTKLSPEGQGQLFEAINTGKIPGRSGLLAFTETIRDQERQVAMFEPEPEEERPTEDDKRAVRTFMDRIEQVAALLRSSIVENEIVAVGKVNPNDADSAADLVKAMMTDLRRIEAALRVSAARQGGTVLPFRKAE